MKLIGVEKVIGSKTCRKSRGFVRESGHNHLSFLSAQPKNAAERCAGVGHTRITVRGRRRVADLAGRCAGRTVLFYNPLCVGYSNSHAQSVLDVFFNAALPSMCMTLGVSIGRAARRERFWHGE